MHSLLSNWRTTLTGALIVGIAALKTFAGVNVPGAMDLPTALTVAVGLFVAKDGASPAA